MKTRIFFIVIGAIIILGIAGALISNKSGDKAPDANTTFAQCIKDSGTKFFGAFWCPHCQAQKKLFGARATKELPYIECSTADGKDQTQACKDADIKSYPTWEFADGTRKTGKQTFADLAEKTGCVAPEEQTN